MEDVGEQADISSPMQKEEVEELKKEAVEELKKEEVEELKREKVEELKKSDEEGEDRPINVEDFFPEINDDLSLVTWAHAVNTCDALKAALEDPKVMMIEADILLGHVQDEVKGKPIMCHPPNTTSDVGFGDWLDKVITTNQNGQRKGIKLDFKEMSVVKECLQELKHNKHRIKFPVWLNADILAGPIDSPTTPLPAEEFIKACVDMYPQGTLSLGWTTHVPPSSSGAVGSGYSRGTAETMVQLLEECGVSQPVTFPIRACFLPHSLETLLWLLDMVPDSTITIWSLPSDPFDPEALLTLKDDLSPDSLFLDLPPAQDAQLRRVGEEGGGRNVMGVVGVCVGVGLVSMLAGLYMY